MNNKQKEYCDKIKDLWQMAGKKVIARSKNEIQPHERALDLLSIMSSGNPLSMYSAKQEYLSILFNVVETSCFNNNIKNAEEIKREHTLRLDEAFPLVPIDPDKRYSLVNKIKNMRDFINENRHNLCQESQERLRGALNFFYRIIINDVPDSQTRRILKSNAKFHNDNMGRFGRIRARQLIDSNILVTLAELIQSIPAIWDDLLCRRVIVENEFLNQIYLRIASGESIDNATSLTLDKIKDKNLEMYEYLYKLIQDIRSVEEICYTISDKRSDNLLALYQMESVHRFLNNSENYFFIFDEPGTRKTITSIVTLISKMKKDGHSDGRILMVVPSNLLDGCVREISNRLRTDVVSIRKIHEELLSNEDVSYIPNGKFQIDVMSNSVFSIYQCKNIPLNYNAIVIDEVHNFKKRDGTVESKRSNSIIEFINRSSVKYRILLTGTPLINDPTEYANLINEFSGNNCIDLSSLKRFQTSLDRACYIHLVTSGIVIRRCKEYIMDLPPIKIITKNIILNTKQVKELKKLNGHVNKARMESVYKIDYVNKIIDTNKNSKGLIYSYFVEGTEKMDCGLIEEYYNKCPVGRKKIYIAGNGIFDLDGKFMEYNMENARIVRKQFEDSKDPVVAYVSVKTCREGVNEFSSGDFVIWALLPYDFAQIEQGNARIHREGRDKNKECVVYIPICQYRKDDGSVWRWNNNRPVYSFDELCYRLILKKKELMSATCDGIKKKLDGTLDAWKDLTEDSFADLEEWSRGNDKHRKFNKMKYVTETMHKIQLMNQEYSGDIKKEIREINSEIQKEDVDGLDFYDIMEQLETARDSRTAVLVESMNLFKNKISAVHVGCGRAELGSDFKKKCSSLTRIDKFCKGDGIINCDRADIVGINGCKKNSVDYLMATDVMHWDVTSDNIENTMFSFNEVIKNGGYCIITHPYIFSYPFATNKNFLKNKGFELIKQKKHGSIKYYILKKICEHKNSKLMSKKLLPKRVMEIS